ncbi:MAG: LamG-like jellyroll fold domain-containing protein [Saprospiraceae bacterium]
MAYGYENIVEHNQWGANWYSLFKQYWNTGFSFRWGYWGTMVADFSVPLQPNTWYHLAGSYANNEAKLYVNGALDKTVASPIAPTPTNGTLSIGAGSFYRVYFYDGIIDEVRLYGQALEEDDIATLMTTGSNIQAQVNVSNSPIDANRSTQSSLIEESLLNVNILPNPFSNQFTASFELPQQADIRLIDMLGRVIWKGKAPEGTSQQIIELNENYPSGVYLLSVQAGEEQRLIRVIKQ